MWKLLYYIVERKIMEMNDILVPTSYSSEEVRNYISDVRMILADEYGTLCDDHAMEKIENLTAAVQPSQEIFTFFSPGMKLFNLLIYFAETLFNAFF